jgi:glyoxalase family protein
VSIKLDGLHHVSAITADVDANLDFYGRLLGLRLVWQGVNADDPEMRHIAYGDERGAPGCIVTFFEFPHAHRGRAGAGMVRRLLLRVGGEEALDFWERRLSRAGVPAARSSGLRFSDPEGLELELVIDDEDEPRIAFAPGIDEEVAIRGLHGARAFSADPMASERILAGALGMESLDVSRSVARGQGRRGVYDYGPAPAEPGVMGAGTMHHIAFGIRDGEQDRWRERLTAAGLAPTPVLDRRMFKSIYFREPSGVLLELATDQPGFVFEPPEHLGESLVLIGDLEHRRAEIEERFPLLPNPRVSIPATETSLAG